MLQQSVFDAKRFYNLYRLLELITDLLYLTLLEHIFPHWITLAFFSDVERTLEQDHHSDDDNNDFSDSEKVWSDPDIEDINELV